jgi:hypothetical protein
VTTQFTTPKLVIIRVQTRDSLVMLWYADGVLREDLCILRSWN